LNNPVLFIFCYARSGGTIFNRYLANHDKLIVLSEAHPVHNNKRGIYSIKGQLDEWYNISIKSNDYVGQILEAKKWCDENDKFLVIRDWSYIDFARSRLNNYDPPNHSVNVSLLTKRVKIRKMACVRDGIDVYLSQGKNIEEFSAEYLNYSRYIHESGVALFRYEEFVDDPDNFFERVCSNLSLPINPHSENKGALSNNVVGDTNISRGNQSDKLVTLKRRYAGRFEQERINNSSNLIAANELFNYPINYNSRDPENIFDYLMYKKAHWSVKIKRNFVLWR
jgi:hypothetical protein